MKKNRRLLCEAVLTGWLVSGLHVMAVQLIADRHFQDGMIVLDPVSGADEGILQYKDSYSSTQWRLAQWGSQQTVSGAGPTALLSGALGWSNAFKTIVTGPMRNEDAELVLAVNAINEYGGVYREAGESWPHLLVSQGIGNPQGWFKEVAPWISDLNEVFLDIELNLRHADHIYTNGYSSALHAAQFLLYFTIQNLNKSNPGYGDYFWFGLRFYDDRESLPGLSVNHDIGTGKLIYNIGIAPFTDEGMTAGEWKRIRGDLLPHIKAGLQEAWICGYLTNSFDLADYKIGGMNMGWEVPGLSDVSMQVRNFSVQAYGLDFARTFEFNEDGDPEGWTAVNMTEIGTNDPANGIWALKVPGSEPQMIGPAMRLSAERYPAVAVRLANDGNPAEYSVAQLFWKRCEDIIFSEDRSVSIPVSNGGGWATYNFDVGTHSNWMGEIVQFRLDPVLAGDDHAVGVDWIRPLTAAVLPEDAPQIQMAGDTLFWEGTPYQQYIVQQSTNLLSGGWIDLTEAAPFSDSVMTHSAAQTNSASFFRLLTAPGP
jgi:hypothetical protein